MNKTNTSLTKQLMLLMAALFISGSLLSQNTTITDVSSHPADASAVLDVHSNTLGMLMPRLSSAPGTPATGLLYYNTSSNSFLYNAGTSGTPSWTELSYGNLWSRTGTTDTYLTNMTDNLLIGTGTAGLGYKFYVYGATSQQSRFDGQVKFHNNSTGPLLADVNDFGTGNGVINLYSGGSQTTQLLAAGPSYFMGGNVGIGIPVPQNLLHLQDLTGTPFPQLQIDNAGAPGNVSIGLLQNATNKVYSLGIYDDATNQTDYNFKICNSATLTGPGYGDPTTMMEIHDGNNNDGIIDFNHQSRARVFQAQNTSLPEYMQYVGQFIPPSTWTMVNFDGLDYDEHSEWFLAQSANMGPSYFVATETGYYQVNSRVDFLLEQIIEGMEELEPINNPNFPGYVSIAIFVSSNNGNSWSMYAQGNKLQGADNGVSGGYNDLRNNLAPNVNDVVKLDAGDWVSIWVWQNLGMLNTPPFQGIPLRVIEQNGEGFFPTQCYVSIHKIS